MGIDMRKTSFKTKGVFFQFDPTQDHETSHGTSRHDQRHDGQHLPHHQAIPVQRSGNFLARARLQRGGRHPKTQDARLPRRGGRNHRHASSGDPARRSRRNHDHPRRRHRHDCGRNRQNTSTKSPFLAPPTSSRSTRTQMPSRRSLDTLGWASTRPSWWPTAWTSSRSASVKVRKR